MVESPMLIYLQLCYVLLLLFVTDSTVTPIQIQDDVGHGQMLDSDSMSDFNAHREAKPLKSKRLQRRSGSREKSSGDSKSQRSRDRRILNVDHAGQDELFK